MIYGDYVFLGRIQRALWQILVKLSLLACLVGGWVALFGLGWLDMYGRVWVG